MSSLIVLCPHCLTWTEPHAQSCTECGCAVNADDNDPSTNDLADRLGERLIDLGPVKLHRRGWPGCGRLLATTEGLLFVPQFLDRKNGSLEAVTDDRGSHETSGGSSRIANLIHWWSLPPWRRPHEDAAPLPAAPEEIPHRAPLEVLLDSPGAVFIRRNSIQRILIRWGRVQIERRPSRSVSLVQVPGGPTPRDCLRLLAEFAPWKSIVASLS